MPSKTAAAKMCNFEHFSWISMIQQARKIECVHVKCKYVLKGLSWLTNYAVNSTIGPCKPLGMHARNFSHFGLFAEPK